ncbi:HU family DNA-binding protein [Candidatus Thioglobus sp.]|jgi:integration host factor subunit beta|uniref:HU family DNA-binding protein n=1 Tax=Candidatus Thioglobus sp. TaxID=2026721 RepID=UPI001DAFD885|nr:HU family DNA-binding protein [Candidatus Thioglobus sp.]MBT3277616.1 integration host factor subunit beta [Candidatus Thioglobus sp.]MBT4746973.1 integration host factor subunit beta [Candidatus Thioglobus sp.]MBT6360108.1 integration host factor subunit beta [Candidatus Thioglobus sp.]MBT6753063.1 integration host factor subunit beta [Candidatus Thioglobus sp.]MBT7839843.1 integration host factor subunit beta [Candidatus Thioglobus sp.]
MKKTDLVQTLTERSNLAKSDVKLAVDCILEKISQSIVSGEGVEIRGFGGFLKKHRKARQGINPKTSERTRVGEKYVPFFKPGKSLKEMVNKG